jgi:hypothetical protein
MTGEILFGQGLYLRYSPGNKNGRSGGGLITLLDCHEGATHSQYACNLVLSLKLMTQRMKLLDTLPTTYPNASIFLILCHAIAGNYLMTLVLRGIRNALNRSLKALMISLRIPTYRQRRFCRRHIIHSLICLALRSRLLSQRRISKISGDGSMKGHHLLLVGSLSCITRLLHQTQCCPQCTPRI